jgi:hypothetical protein
MTLIKTISYEVKISRNEEKIPVVNGVHLHSIYNPFKEAEGLVAAQAEALRNKKEILVLGLGFGYHVNTITDKLTQLYDDDFRVVVIEPNSQVYDDCIALNLLKKKNVLVYSGFNSNKLYSDLNLIHFLLRKPAIIAHPPSFNLYQNYFKAFLTFEAPRHIKEIIEFITSPEIKKYLSTFPPESELEEILFKEIPAKKQLEQIDFLTMALVEMTKRSCEKNSDDKFIQGDNLR